MSQAQAPIRPACSASQALWDEWVQKNPQTPQDIDAFYRDTKAYASDLDAWHELEGRAQWTTATVHIAQNTVKPKATLDIGCGRGHDLRALRDALPGTRVEGVEVNEHARKALRNEGFAVYPDIAVVNLAEYDLVTCFDVLEHVVDPEAFLTDIASRMRLGAVFIETTATDDISTPLHLKDNWGWYPGRALERCGFVLLDRQGRYGVWQRVRERAIPDRTSLIVCSWRAVSIATKMSILALCGVDATLLDGDNDEHLMRIASGKWRVRVKSADGLISRSRSIVVSQWWRETADDVLLMVDDDIGFSAGDAERIVQKCRETGSIVCGAYPVGDGSHLAVRMFDYDNEIEFGQDTPLKEIEYGATGFMAIHRNVVDAMITRLGFPLCHANERWSFWPIFACEWVPMGQTYAYLSEDWAFCKRARMLGFSTYCDPTIRLAHVKEIEVGVGNMDLVHAAIQKGAR